MSSKKATIEIIFVIDRPMGVKEGGQVARFHFVAILSLTNWLHE